MLIVAVPLVRWKEVCIGRAEIVTGALVVGIVLFATLIDYQHYAGAEWAAFHALDTLRGWLTDYNFADYILEHPEQMHANGFSKNDILLIAIGQARSRSVEPGAIAGADLELAH